MSYMKNKVIKKMNKEKRAPAKKRLAISSNNCGKYFIRYLDEYGRVVDGEAVINVCEIVRGDLDKLRTLVNGLAQIMSSIACYLRH